MKRFGFCKKCDDVSWLSYRGSAINLSELPAEATENDLAELSEERLRLLESSFALGIYYTFLDFIPGCFERYRVEGCIAQLVHLGA